MKGDFTRDTFKPERHYQQVLMQQGRVQIDADWNEQVSIASRRDATTALDIIGHCGGPADAAAFGLFTDPSRLGDRDKAQLEAMYGKLKDGDFFLSPGRYYVDGIQCENESALPYTCQPDRLDVKPLDLPKQDSPARHYLIYLDVWHRHLTALDDSEIREPALGGVDTGTRVKTVWQVRHLEIPKLDGDRPCNSSVPEFDKLLEPPTARLSAKTEHAAASDDPCEVPETAGYKGLENQLYRIEIHDSTSDPPTGRTKWKWSRENGSVVAEIISIAGYQITLATLGPDERLGFRPGHWVEILDDSFELENLPGQLIQVEAYNEAERTLTFKDKVSSLGPKAGVDPQRHPKVRRWEGTGDIKWKWSREEGAASAEIMGIRGNQILLATFRPGDRPHFRPGQWIEILDDLLEKKNLPGRLLEVVAYSEIRRTLTLSGRAAPLAPLSKDGIDPERHPRVRRWKTVTEGSIAALENAVQIEFDEPTARYYTGQFWQIPARAATPSSLAGDIEWPRESDAQGRPKKDSPASLPPRGIIHHYGRLGIATIDHEGTLAFTDCRCLYPVLNTVPRLFYVSGDGQEVMPDLTQHGQFWKLPFPLVLGVANAQCLGESFSVRFRITAGGGQLACKDEASANSPLEVTSDTAGLAVCEFHLDGITPNQQVTAYLLDEANNEVSPPIVFNANLSIANQVAYKPGDHCVGLEGKTNVQSAIDQLAGMVSLYKVSGDGQHAIKVGKLKEPLCVRVANRCGPVEKMTVTFKVIQGGGKVAPGSAKSDTKGEAKCEWFLGEESALQVVEAAIVDDGAKPVTDSTKVLFIAHLSTASQVAYDPSGCSVLKTKGATNVQQALDELCKLHPECDRSLDDLHADGIVRSPEGSLGFDVRISEQNALSIDYSSGIAYVGGCRHVIPTGSLAGIDESTAHQTLLVDNQGKIRLIIKDELPEKYAAIAVISTYGGKILRIVDTRFDLTHIDEKVANSREEIAATRPDRRQFVPLLAYSIKGVKYRNGRNVRFQFDKFVPSGLASDGENIWVANDYDTKIARIPRGAMELADVKFPNLESKSRAVAYDGRYLWFALMGQKFVRRFDPKIRAPRDIPVESEPTAIVFDGDFIWVCHDGSNSVTEIDAETCQVVRVISWSDKPVAIAFDGSHIWVAGEKGSICKIEKPWGDPEQLGSLKQRPRGPLVFDGTCLWFCSGSDLMKIDIENNHETQVAGLSNIELIAFDGIHLWASRLLEDKSTSILKIDVDTGQLLGEGGKIAGSPNSAAFDGTHLWISSDKGVFKKLV
jgi:hypothetical protein